MPVADFLPLKPIDYQILLVLTEGPRHGYGIMKAVEDESNGRVHLEIGSLYRIVRRMLVSGLIEEAQVEGSLPSPGEARRYFRLSGLGAEVAEAESRRLEDLVTLARHKRVLDPKGGVA